MNNTVFTKNYDAPLVNRAEILRYAGMRGDSGEVDVLIEECLCECLPKLAYKVCFMELPITVYDECVDLTFAKIQSSSLVKNLKVCNSIILFAATVGIEIDRLIARYGTVSPAKALLFQALGTERIESLCDAFCNDLKKEKNSLNKGIKPRFSPGYGDLSIEFQRDIFKVLEPSRRIGLMLNESLIMSPSKSVTAIVGICDGNEKCDDKSGCDFCNEEDCIYRRNI